MHMAFRNVILLLLFSYPIFAAGIDVIALLKTFNTAINIPESPFPYQHFFLLSSTTTPPSDQPPNHTIQQEYLKAKLAIDNDYKFLQETLPSILNDSFNSLYEHVSLYSSQLVLSNFLIANDLNPSNISLDLRKDFKTLYTYYDALLQTWNSTMYSILETLYDNVPLNLYVIQNISITQEASKVFESIRNMTMSPNPFFKVAMKGLPYSNLTTIPSSFSLIGDTLKFIDLNWFRFCTSKGIRQPAMSFVKFKSIAATPAYLNTKLPTNYVYPKFNLLGLSYNSHDVLTFNLQNSIFAENYAPFLNLIHSNHPSKRNYTSNSFLLTPSADNIRTVIKSLIQPLLLLTPYENLKTYFIYDHNCVLSPFFNLRIISLIDALLTSLTKDDFTLAIEAMMSSGLLNEIYPGICTVIPSETAAFSLSSAYFPLNVDDDVINDYNFLTITGFNSTKIIAREIETSDIDFQQRVIDNFVYYLYNSSGPALNVSISYTTSLWSTYFSGEKAGSVYPNELGNALVGLTNAYPTTIQIYNEIQTSMLNDYSYLRKLIFHLFDPSAKLVFPTQDSIYSTAHAKLATANQANLKICSEFFNAHLCVSSFDYRPIQVSIYYDTDDKKIYGYPLSYILRLVSSHQSIQNLPFLNASVSFSSEIIAGYGPRKGEISGAYNRYVSPNSQLLLNYCNQNTSSYALSLDFGVPMPATLSMLQNQWSALCKYHLNGTASVTSLPLIVDSASQLAGIVKNINKTLEKQGISNAVYRISNNSYASPFFDPFNYAALLYSSPEKPLKVKLYFGNKADAFYLTDTFDVNINANLIAPVVLLTKDAISQGLSSYSYHIPPYIDIGHGGMSHSLNIKRGKHTIAIACGVVFSLVFIIICAGSVYCFWRFKKDKKSSGSMTV